MCGLLNTLLRLFLTNDPQAPLGTSVPLVKDVSLDVHQAKSHKAQSLFLKESKKKLETMYIADECHSRVSNSEQSESTVRYSFL